MKKEANFHIFLRGVLLENPVFVLVLGTCPTLATTASMGGALAMGLATAAVLVCSSAMISLLRSLIPAAVRIPCYIVVIAGFVTLVQMLMHAFLPEMYALLGIYLALITVNCIILGRAEMFAGKSALLPAVLDGAGMGVGFTLALTAMALVRETLGGGTFFGAEIPFISNYRVEFLQKPPGGFLVFGLILALVNAATKCKAIKKKDFDCGACPSACGCAPKACPAADENLTTKVGTTEKEEKKDG